MSETPTVVQALAAVMGQVQAVGKTGRNQAQGYNFRGIDAVMNAVGPALRDHGVVIAPEVLDVAYRDVEVGAKRSHMREATVRVRYTAYGPAGDTLSATVAAEALDSGDKATAKAMSVAYRTCLLQLLTIPTDEPDPDGYSYERSAAVEIVGKATRDRLHAALLSLPDVDEAKRAWRDAGLPKLDSLPVDLVSAAEELLAGLDAAARDAVADGTEPSA